MIQRPKYKVRKEYRGVYEQATYLLECSLRGGLAEVYEAVTHEKKPQRWTQEQLAKMLTQVCEQVSLELVTDDERRSFHKVNGKLIEFIASEPEANVLWKLSSDAVNISYYVGLLVGEGMRQECDKLVWRVDHCPSYLTFCQPLLCRGKLVNFPSMHVGSVLVLQSLLGVNSHRLSEYIWAKWVGETICGVTCKLEHPGRSHVDVYPPRQSSWQ